MKVIVFGATGSVGKLFVSQALDAGHEVTAFARNPVSLALTHPNLSLCKGDAMDAASVAKALKGQDAVVVALGAGTNRKSKIRSIGTLNVIHGMQQHGIDRLICQSTLGAHESWSNLNFVWKRLMFGALLRPVYKDHLVQEDMVRASGLDWTLVRPSAFTDVAPEGNLEVGFGPDRRGLALKIARSEVAGFLLKQLNDLTYRRRAVGISY